MKKKIAKLIINLQIQNRNMISIFFQKQKQSLNHTIEKTQNLGSNEFLRLVYSTYPIFMKEQYTFLNFS